MALDTAVETEGSPHTITGITAPASMKAGWITVISAGGMTVQDNATITNPTTQITSSTRRIIQRRSRGTHLILRMKYDSTLATITSPVVKVFGRVGPGEAWQLLYSRDTNLVETITADTTNDARDGTFNYTTPDFAIHAWDCLGCDELLVGIQTVLAGSTGSTATALLQAKII